MESYTDRASDLISSYEALEEELTNTSHTSDVLRRISPRATCTNIIPQSKRDKARSLAVFEKEFRRKFRNGQHHLFIREVKRNVRTQVKKFRQKIEFIWILIVGMSSNIKFSHLIFRYTGSSFIIINFER